MTLVVHVYAQYIEIHNNRLHIIISQSSNIIHMYNSKKEKMSTYNT